MLTSRLFAAVVAAGLGTAPAFAGEYDTFRHLVVSPTGEPGCRISALLNVPSAWHPGDAAVVLLTTRPSRDAVRDTLVAALLYEDVAVLELSSAPCRAPDRPEPAMITASALGALDAITRYAGAGMVVAIGYGPEGKAVLEAMDDRMAAILGTGGPHFAAAVAMGDGAPSLAVGAIHPVRAVVSARLTLLCTALSMVADAMGAVPERAAPAAAADVCRTAMTGEPTLAATPLAGAPRQ